MTCDESLYRQYLSGDDEGLNALMKKYGDPLTLYIDGYLHDALGAGAGGDVLQIVILLGDLVIVVLQSASDELRCVGACWLGRIVLVFKHPTAEREVPQNLFHHLFLL